MEVYEIIEPLFMLNCEVYGRFSKFMTSESRHLVNISVKFQGFSGKFLFMLNLINANFDILIYHLTHLSIYIGNWIFYLPSRKENKKW